jgi:hypothetical protein
MLAEVRTYVSLNGKKILHSSNTIRIEKWAYFLGLSVMSFKLAPIFFIFRNLKNKDNGRY